MRRSIGDTTELALDAAADLILANPPEPPAAPSITQLCKSVGIGASTFYRLYGNAEEFRLALAVYIILESYEPGRQAVLTRLERRTSDPATPKPGSTTESERAALIGALSQTFQGTGVRRDAMEATYLPWLHNSNIASAIRESFETASVDYEEIADSFLEWAGRTSIPTSSPDDIMRRILSIVLACDLVPVKSKWQTKADESVSTVVYAHVNLAEALSRPVETG